MSSPILDELRRCGALLHGHFNLSSGLHSGQYVQCALLFDDPRVGRRLTGALAQRVQRATQPPVERVVSAAIGGILVGHELGAALGVRSCFAERDKDGRMALRRGFHIREGERVLIAEDVVTTGRSAAEVAEVVHREGGTVVGQAALVDRSQGEIALNFPLFSLVQLEVETWDPSVCPLCKRGKPLQKPGSRPEA